MSFHAPEKFRVTRGPLGTSPGDGKGLFFVPVKGQGTPLRCIVHDGVDGVPEGHEMGGWEHVSVSLPGRCPTWLEMDMIKGLFWGDEDAVMQLHPPRSTWVNCHPFCLHLWRPLDATIPLPPTGLVGMVTG